MDASQSIHFTKCGEYEIRIDTNGKIAIKVPTNCNIFGRLYRHEELYFDANELQNLASTAKLFRDRRTCYLAHNK